MLYFLTMGIVREQYSKCHSRHFFIYACADSSKWGLFGRYTRSAFRRTPSGPETCKSLFLYQRYTKGIQKASIYLKTQNICITQNKSLSLQRKIRKIISNSTSKCSKKSFHIISPHRLRISWLDCFCWLLVSFFGWYLVNGMSLSRAMHMWIDCFKSAHGCWCWYALRWPCGCSPKNDKAAHGSFCVRSPLRYGRLSWVSIWQHLCWPYWHYCLALCTTSLSSTWLSQ